MTDQELRERYMRMLNVLRTIVHEPEKDEEDAYFERYDAAIEAGKKLVEEEDKAPVA